MNDKANEYKKLFLEESEEYLAALSENLMAVEKDKSDKKLMDNIFRTAHTLKSSAAALGYDDLSVLAHKAEDVMQKIRSGEKEVDTALIDVFFEFIDVIKYYLKDLSEDKTPSVDLNATVKKLEGLIDGSKPAKDQAVPPREIPPVPSGEIRIDLTEYEKKLIHEARKAEKQVYLITVVIDSREQIKWLRTELILNKINEMGQMVRLYPDKEEIMKPGYPGVFSVILTSTQSADNIRDKIRADLIREIRIEEVKDEKKIAVDLSAPRGARAEEKEKGRKDYITKEDETMISDQAKRFSYNVITSSDTIRVPVNKLDVLMNLVGELVISNSGMKQVENRFKDIYRENAFFNEINFITDKMVNIVSELQNNVMNMRMVPIVNVFSQFTRVVRDLSRDQNKQIELILKGEETELDKKVIDEIGVPLTHLVRNAVDHGIETLEERIKKGKPARARIVLSAFHQGNQIVISVKDDGRGVDVAKVKEKALAAGLVNKADLENMSEAQIVKLIFRYGFSTKEEVSSVSGRGVGLDVVEKSITGLGGHISIHTVKEEGTEFVIMLPLTLAVTASILVEVNTGLYAVPITHIRECIRIKGREIKTVEGYWTVRLRGDILPVIDIGELLENRKVELEEDKEYTVIVSYRQNRGIGLMVDNILGEQEIVLKPLEKHYAAIPGLSGAAILGDGKIVLVLDVVSLIQLYKYQGEEQEVMAETGDRSAGAGEREPEEQAKEQKPEPQPAHGQEREEKPVREQVREQKVKQGRKPAGDKQKFLNELFRHSFEQAASSLSRLVQKEVDIFAASVDQMSGETMVNELEENMGEPMCCSVMKSEGELSASMIFIIPENDALRLYGCLVRKPGSRKKRVNADVVSAIGEVNNIIGSTFLNNLANLISRKMNPTVPLSRFDMLGALMQGVITQSEFVNKKMYCARTKIRIKGQKEMGIRFIIMSDKDDLIKIIEEIKV